MKRRHQFLCLIAVLALLFGLSILFLGHEPARASEDPPHLQITPQQREVLKLEVRVAELEQRIEALETPGVYIRPFDPGRHGFLNRQGDDLTVDVGAILEAIK